MAAAGCHPYALVPSLRHQVIVEWVVVGQTIGFIGSLVGALLPARPSGTLIGSSNKRSVQS